MKPKKKYLVKVYGGGNGRTLINTYEYDTLKEAKASKAAHDRFSPQRQLMIVIAEDIST